MGLLPLLLLAAQTEVGIVVDPEVPRTNDFATQLSGELAVPTTVRTATHAVDAILSGRLPDWPEPLIVLFEPASGRVVVARRADATILLRALDTAASSYAAAIAAAELIRFARLPIPKRGEPPTARLLPAVFLSLGLGVTESFAHEPLLLEPRLFIGAELLDAEHGIFTGVAVGARAPVETTRNQILYRRWGPAVAVAGGWKHAWLRIGLRLEAGVAITEARATTPEGAIEGRDRRAPAWIAVGPVFEIAVGVGLSVVLDAALGATASPADYLVRDQVAVAEGRLRWSAALSLRWRWQAQ